MGSVGLPLLLGLLGCALAVAAVVACAVVARRSRRRTRRRERELAEQLARSRAELAALHRRVEELSGKVVQAREAAETARSHPEFLITSLVPALDAAPPAPAGLPRPPLGRLLEEQVVHALARERGRSPVRERAVGAVVRAMALGHGLRRALTPEVLDRAAAEVQVARRRSRRERRREERAARRVVREVRRKVA